MGKFITFLLVLVAYYILLTFSATAVSKNFKTSYDVTYAINEDGITNVLFKINLSNLTSQYYASSYKLTVGLSQINNLAASDPNGKIIPKVLKTEDGQSIELVFNKKVVGITDSLSFSLSFDTKEVSQKQGHSWEVNIPRFSNQESFENFVVHIKTPSSFGPPTYIKPKPKTNNLDFTKEDLGKSGISLGFGDTQYYSFGLTYHLSNKHLFPIVSEIAFPPSTNYQDVVIDSISKKPASVIKDRDGNNLGKFALSPSEKFDVKIRGRIKVFLYPKKELLKNTDEEVYLKQKPYWEKDQKITDLARKLKTPEAIYTYVVNALTYDFTRVTGNSPRVGAKAILENPHSAVCLEFTDLFIALSRAAGIPAREVDGFAYTQNKKQRPLSLVKDVLHAWPEYYDRKQQAWIMVDPTWGNTTGGLDYFSLLDTNHIAFAKRGVSSTYPIPAGGYKPEELKNVKDVEITFTEKFDPQTEDNVFANLPKDSSSNTITTSFITKIILIGGVLVAGFTILLLTITKSARDLPFFRRKR